MINILGFAGSLRKGSYNRMLLKNCLDLLPPGAALEIFDLEGIPPFNQDFEKTFPPLVAEFKRRIKSADAILIVTPEANYSIPGMMKNAMDWASRPYGDNSFAGKNVAIMSASIGMLGGARAQYHLRQSFVFLDMHAVNIPEVFLAFAADKFDPSGRLLDDKSRELMRTLLATLVEQTKKAHSKT
jgi:chromate reductase, NAD(P)H dehydrogenase (quinone)